MFRKCDFMSELTGKRIKERRAELGLSQEELAEKTGVTRTTVAKWESGENNLKQSKIKTIAKALDCSPVWIVGLDDSTNIVIEIERNMDELDERNLQRIIKYAEYLLAKGVIK